jgi:hypothetical protein
MDQRWIELRRGIIRFFLTHRNHKSNSDAYRPCTASFCAQFFFARSDRNAAFLVFPVWLCQLKGRLCFKILNCLLCLSRYNNLFLLMLIWTNDKIANWMCFWLPVCWYPLGYVPVICIENVNCKIDNPQNREKKYSLCNLFMEDSICAKSFVPEHYLNLKL